MMSVIGASTALKYQPKTLSLGAVIVGDPVVMPPARYPYYHWMPSIGEQGKSKTARWTFLDHFPSPSELTVQASLPVPCSYRIGTLPSDTYLYDIVLYSQNEIVVLDGKSLYVKRTLYTSDLPNADGDIPNIKSISTYDIDGDGHAEILVFATYYSSTFNYLKKYFYLLDEKLIIRNWTYLEESGAITDVPDGFIIMGDSSGGVIESYPTTASFNLYRYSNGVYTIRGTTNDLGWRKGYFYVVFTDKILAISETGVVVAQYDVPNADTLTYPYDWYDTVFLPRNLLGMDAIGLVFHGVHHVDASTSQEFVELRDFDLSLVWRSYFNAGGEPNWRVADIDGDGVEEVVLGGSTIVKLGRDPPVYSVPLDTTYSNVWFGAGLTINGRDVAVGLDNCRLVFRYYEDDQGLSYVADISSALSGVVGDCTDNSVNRVVAVDGKDNRFDILLSVQDADANCRIVKVSYGA